MHPNISEFPSMRFYGSQLRDAPSVAAQLPIPGFVWPSLACRVCFVDCGRGGEDSGRSKANPYEASILVMILRRCLAAGVKASDIGVITGYSAQQALLQHSIVALGVVAMGVRIDTVDGFQGSERELVLASTVRANAACKFGFMGDPRRVNVMLTRARRGLILLGDASTLEADAETWRPWLSWGRKRGAVVSAREIEQQLQHPVASEPHRADRQLQADKEEEEVGDREEKQCEVQRHAEA